MKKYFTNKFNSYQNTIGILSSKSDVYSGIPVAVAAVEDFRNILDQIKVVGEKAGFDNTELTMKKQRIKHDMAELVSQLASAVSLYARKIDDPDLEAIASTTYTRVRKARDFESLEMSRNFQSLLLMHKEALQDYMVSEKELNELAELIEAFDAIYVTREETHSESVMDNQRLERLFRQADRILRERIDKVVRRLKRENPDFCNSYFQARVIVDL